MKHRVGAYRPDILMSTFIFTNSRYNAAYIISQR